MSLKDVMCSIQQPVHNIFPIQLQYEKYICKIEDILFFLACSIELLNC